jgi:hypothetical protein
LDAALPGASIIIVAELQWMPQCLHGPAWTRTGREDIAIINKSDTRAKGLTGNVHNNDLSPPVPAAVLAEEEKKMR